MTTVILSLVYPFSFRAVSGVVVANSVTDSAGAYIFSEVEPGTPTVCGSSANNLTPAEFGSVNNVNFGR